MFAIAEFVLMIAIGIVLADQVITQLWKGLPVFPFFRTKKLSAKVAEAREDVEVAETESLLDSLRDEAAAYRKKDETE